MDVIKWDQIMAECDGFRAGFVTVFRKYEGMPTNQKDERGRPIKVTVSSFAEHAGIARTTFRTWVGTYQDGRDRRAGSARSGQMGRQIAKNPTVAVEDKVGMLKDLMSDKKVMKAFTADRTPIVSESDAKAADAWAKAITQPILDAVSPLAFPMICDYIKEATAYLAENELDEESVRKIARLIKRLNDEVEVQQFRLGLIEVS